MIQIILLLIMLYWIGGIFFAVKKGLNEIIKGLQSIDEKLTNLQGKK